MSADLHVPAGLPVVLVALACLIGGAAWFADALRALRVRRAWSGLVEQPLGSALEGVARVKGRVALTGPLFSPLGNRPCAGFVLEAHGLDERLHGCVRELRAFDLRDGGEVAHVDPAHAHWALPVSQEQAFAAGEPLGGTLAALLDRHPELAWLRRRSGAIRVVERALHHGDRVTVIAQATRMEFGAESAAEAATWLATGTDGAAQVAPVPVASASASWTLTAPEGFSLQLLAEGADRALARVPSPVRTWGAVLGPLLALAGLLTLARLAGAAWGGR